MKHEFVEFIPETIAQDTIYISIPFATAVHLCACGCRQQVVTPLAPSGWTLSFNGTISLHPSIGNWSFPCQSHYWISDDEVIWARRWTPKEIAAEREEDRSEQPIKPRWWQKLERRR